MPKAKTKTLKVLDLFCGSGGLSFGVGLAEFKKLKFEVVAGLDFHKPSVETFEKNHPGAKGFCVDIRQASVEGLAEEIGSVDVIIGGPSCQGFSTHGNRLVDDPRNFLFKYFMQFVDVMKPRWVVMENVTGLLRYKNGQFRDEIVDHFRRMGYVVSFAQLQAADYGVPQTRKRLLFVANRAAAPFFFPQPTHGDPQFEQLSLGVGSRQLKPYVTVRDAIGDLPMIGLGTDGGPGPSSFALPPQSPFQAWCRAESDSLTLHTGQRVPRENLARIRHIPPGGDWLDIPERMKPERFSRVLRKDATTLYYRLRWDRPAYTITTVYRNVSSGAFTHPDEDRALTHREAARIQTFPDSFHFVPSSIPRQIGNAVPPLLAAVVGRALLVHEHVLRTSKKKLSVAAFEAQIRALEPNEIVSSVSKSFVPEIKTLRTELPVIQRAISDSEWAELKRSFASLDLQRRSQVDLRGVANALLALVAGAERDEFISRSFADLATVKRLIVEWKEAGVLERVLSALASGVRPSEEFPTISRVKLQRQPTRRRSRPNSTHHFATVLYPVESSSRCTVVVEGRA